MKYLLLLCFLFFSCTDVRPKFNKNDKVTLKKENGPYCHGYVKRILHTGITSFLDKKEPQYYLDLHCKNRDLIFSQPVNESDLILVPRKVTQEQWEEIRAKGPKFTAGTEITNDKGCKASTSDPYLNDDGEWLYPLAQEKCPNNALSNFPPLLEEEHIELLADINKKR